ncbi:leucine rich repeat protein [Nannizzia gypsea CBS 118893]|uniref:Leucine rich repeat protein n=1 Tax=Arthroderma gypseum (strain ATCC MYA-4604 / CBS 118893) TaxID=535722 RepID=E5R194_ARTGP|nr:leucine rich repeat protein [Nannizzia gypsea CBS 118893]EFQ98483.1 leucine rich repeat protein [Nannizzia gypsea CBS 118893]
MADVFPPSYESATTRDVWPIIAPFVLSAAELCSACLVSRAWHGVFAPVLWGAPASHFGARDDAVYGAHNYPYHKPSSARLTVDIHRLTHTLHLPPALAEIYGEPPSRWLHEFMEYLPNLQSLLLSRLPFFDHRSLVALGKGEGYNARLFLAEREMNATPAGLVALLNRCLRLVYLDLSYTTAARDSRVILTLRQLRGLQALKLRGIGLQDDDVEVLAKVIQTRVRLLDIGDNRLTDRGLSFLTNCCFLLNDSDASSIRGNAHFGPLTGALLADSIRSEHLGDHLLRLFTRRLSGLSALEELPHVGLTHLYIAGNNISATGLIDLLHTKRLNVLDAGAVKTGMEKLIPVLKSPIAQSLTYLRAHHSILRGRDTTRNMSPQDLLAGGKNSTSMIQMLLGKRPAFYKTNMDEPLYLHPSNVAHLRTLVLTDIPAFVTSSSPTISSITRFISACADEALLASLQAESSYSLPPGQYRAKAIQQHAKELFALAIIVLEISPGNKFKKPECSSAWVPTGYYQPNTFKSSTGDLDSENLWAAASNDFSFFDEDEETRSTPNPEVALPPARMVDVVAELAAFRREKRDAYSKRVQGTSGTGVSPANGHWKGEVRIQRNRL